MKKQEGDRVQARTQQQLADMTTALVTTHKALAAAQAAAAPSNTASKVSSMQLAHSAPLDSSYATPVCLHAAVFRYTSHL